MARLTEPELLAYDRARLRVRAGLPVAVDTATPRRLARAVGLAEETGAPLLEVIEAARRAAADRHRAAGAVRVAAAQPRLVAAVVLLLPLALSGVVGTVTGAWPADLLRSPLGQRVLVVAASMQVLGAAAVVLLLRRSARGNGQPGDVSDDELVDLVVAALRSGRPAGAALRDAADLAPGRGAGLRRAALAIERGGEVGAEAAVVCRVAALLREAEACGASAVDVLADLAARDRDERRDDALARAGRLPVLLTMPTALLLLPAAVLLVGAPLLLHAVGAA